MLFLVLFACVRIKNLKSNKDLIVLKIWKLFNIKFRNAMIEIFDKQDGNKKLRRTYEDYLPLETQETQQPTEPAEPTETQETAEPTEPAAEPTEA